MQTASPPPRRKWHFKRWFIVLSIAIFAWSGWRVYDKRSAIKEAEALGWNVLYTDPSEAIRADWKNTFRKETWTDGVTFVGISTSEAFQQHVAIVRRLNPLTLEIEDASTLRDLSVLPFLTRVQQLWLHNSTELTNVDALKNITTLQSVWLQKSKGLTNVDALKDLPALEIIDLTDCTGLTNVDALKNLTTLQHVWLPNYTGLTNVDALKNLPALRRVNIQGCSGLTPESVDALRAALPKAIIMEP